MWTSLSLEYQDCGFSKSLLMSAYKDWNRRSFIKSRNYSEGLKILKRKILSKHKIIPKTALNSARYKILVKGGLKYDIFFVLFDASFWKEKNLDKSFS